MNITDIAKKLGRKGGQARARKLSPEARKQIASLGGKSRVKSLEAARRIIENFRYLDAIRDLSGKSKKITRIKTLKGRLPGIYA